MSDKSKIEETPGESDSVAVIAELLYLSNLLVVPIFSFGALLWYYRKRANYSQLAAEHLQQTVSASLWAGILLVAVNIVVFLTMGYDSPYVWMVVLIYFTMGHSTFILLGVFGMSRALAGKSFNYPLPNLIQR